MTELKGNQNNVIKKYNIHLHSIIHKLSGRVSLCLNEKGAATEKKDQGFVSI